MRTVQCAQLIHGPAILDILNDVILTSTAIYDYKPRTADSMTDWFETKRRVGFPVIGVEDEAGNLLAFATYGTFRAWPAYKYTVEHSVYVHKKRRGEGLGRRVLAALIEEARKRDVHTMVGGIDATNVASIRMHTSLGFSHVGTVRQVGYKFGRWLDLAFYQRIFETPRDPSEDSGVSTL